MSKAYHSLLLCLFLLFLTTDARTQKLKNGNFVAKIAGINISYTIKGKGPVMIVGHPNSGKIGYELSLKPLENKFTIVYYDPRGTGKSGTPDSLSQYSDAHLVNEIDLLREHLHVSKIWLFGHSDQSVIALQYAVDHPENTSGLILSGTQYIKSRESVIEERRKTEEKRASESPWFRQVVKDWDYMIEHKTTTDSAGRDLKYATIKWWCYDEETAQKVIPIYDSISKYGRRRPINNQFPFQTQGEVDEKFKRILEYESKYPTIKIDILILNGKYDTNNPPNGAEKLESVLPNSKLILIDKAGHFPWVEQPEKSFNAIYKWLETIKYNKD
ncbi:MAG: alpha/beta hydrolase [Bacteroidetes bacterium]|nr:alpha/beta hydrolase [Bacteroidota bacterium]